MTEIHGKLTIIINLWTCGHIPFGHGPCLLSGSRKREICFFKMPCAICGSSEISLHEGVHYCAECNTQIEETREELSDAEGFSRRSLLSSSGTERIAKDKNIYYSSWTTIEAYNVILSKQVSALIALGASKELKNAVLHIWSLYLQKCEIAFRKDCQASDQLPCLQPYHRIRDIKVLYGDQIASIKRKYFRGKRIKQKKKTSSAKSKVVENTSEGENSSFKDLSSEWDLPDFSNSELSSDKKQNVKYSSYARKLQREKGKKYLKHKYSTASENCVAHMTMTKTLSFCQLGLIYTQDQLLISDVIRFVNEGRVPYFNASDCLPSFMKLQNYDSRYLNGMATPNLFQVSMMSSKLIHFLDLPVFKHRPLIPLIFRLVKDLNLPNDLMSIIKHLVLNYQKNESEWFEKAAPKALQYPPVPMYENKAAAFVLVALKMLFVLDGNFERKHSEIMIKVNGLNDDHNFFVWKEWQQHSIIKEYLFLPKNKDYPKFRYIDSLSAQKIISRYPFSTLKPASEENSNFFKNVLSSKFVIKDVLSSVVSLDNETLPPPSSFPLKYMTQSFIEEWKTFPMFKEIDDINFDLLNNDFSSKSLSFLPSSIDSETRDLKDNLLSSLYESVPHIPASDLKSYAYKIIVRSSSKYWFKNHKRRKDILKMLPHTFQWLLNFLTNCVGLNALQLYLEVLRVEKKLLIGKKALHYTAYSKNLK